MAYSKHFILKIVASFKLQQRLSWETNYTEVYRNHFVDVITYAGSKCNADLVIISVIDKLPDTMTYAT